MELKQHITDEKTGISYTLQGDYYLPDLVLPEQEGVNTSEKNSERNDILLNIQKYNV